MHRQWTVSMLEIITPQKLIIRALLSVHTWCKYPFQLNAADTHFVALGRGSSIRKHINICIIFRNVQSSVMNFCYESIAAIHSHRIKDEFASYSYAKFIGDNVTRYLLQYGYRLYRRTLLFVSYCREPMWSTKQIYVRQRFRSVFFRKETAGYILDDNVLLIATRTPPRK